MAIFREARETMLLAPDKDIITAEEYFLLNDINTSKQLDLLNDAECKSEFRFYRNDIYRLAGVLNTPDEIVCYNQSKFDGI